MNLKPALLRHIICYVSSVLLISAAALAAPVIQVQPVSQTVNETAPVTFSVAAAGTGTLAYQWQKDGVDIPGATSSSFSLSSAQPWHIGDYTVKVSDNSGGTISSGIAALTMADMQSSLWKGLVGYYTLDEDARDVSLFANHGTVYGARKASGTGNVGSAYEFDGVDDYIDAGNLIRKFDVCSFAFWFKTGNISSKPEVFIQKRREPNGGGVQIGNPYPNVGVAYSLMRDEWGDGMRSVESVDTGLIGRWNYVVCSSSGQEMSLYINGVLIGKSQIPATAALSDEPLWFGRGFVSSPDSYGVRAFTGLLDNIRIYNRALSATEASELYISETKITQNISFAAIPNKLTTDSVTLTATGGGSGNPVTFAVTSGPGEISNGNMLTFTNSGLVTITASQLGNANYLPAEDVSRSFNVTLVPEPDIMVLKASSILADDGGAVSFGGELVGQLGQTINFTISNSGTAELSSLSISKDGANAADFSVSQLSAMNIAVGSYAVTFSVAFSPKALGTRSAAIHIYSNVMGAKSPFDINLSGLGVFAMAPEISVEQVQGVTIPDGGFFDFGNMGTGGGTVTKSFTIKNIGGIDLTGLNITKGGADQAKFTLLSLPTAPVVPGGSTSFTVQVAGLTSGLKTAVLHIASNDEDEASYDITLIATGVAANLPSVTTAGASGITLDGATLNGSVKANNLERAVFFDYGLTTTYGSSVAATPATVTGNVATNVSAVLSNLLPHTKYNFRVRAASNMGSASGANLTFTTPNKVPTAQDDVILALPSAKVVIRALTNDSDPDGDPLSIAPDFTQPGKTVGSIAKVGADLVFTPAAGFTGGSFKYSAMDAFGGKSTATVTLILAECTLGENVTISSNSPPYDLSVTANAPWTVIESIPWLSVEPLAPDATQVRLIPAPNPTKDSRTGTVIIGGKTHTVTQTGVLLAPVLTAPEVIPNAAISASYDLAIPTVNGPVTYTVSGVMPNGLTLSNLTGRITGFPTTPGVYTLTVLAKNVIGNSNPISFDITVLPFPTSLAGNYSATIEDNEPLTDKLGGLMTMSVTATGGVTGTLKLGTGSHAFTGKLNTAVDPLAPDPDHAVLKTTITRSGKPSVALTVNMNSGSTDLISGDVTLPGPEPVSATLTGSKHVWNTAKNPASIYQGNYTMALSDNSGNVQGVGFLTFTVSAAGAVTYSGQLADGTVIAPLSATLWATGDVPLFALLYANKGSLNQSFNIDTGRNISGSPHWLKKPQAATVRAYAAGFETTLSATGAGYSASMAASIASPTGGVVLAFSGGSIENVNQYSDLSQAFTVSAAFAATADWLSPVQMKLTRIDVAKGTFTGSMTLKDLNPFNAALPMISRPVSFNGVLLPAAGMATGYFLLPSITGPPANATTSPITSGRVTIYPN